MNVSNPGDNQTEVSFGGGRILFSYGTPVAAYIPKRGWVRTEENHSRTTGKHIGGFIPDYSEKEKRKATMVERVPQKFMNGLAERIMVTDLLGDLAEEIRAIRTANERAPTEALTSLLNKIDLALKGV